MKHIIHYIYFRGSKTQCMKLLAPLTNTPFSYVCMASQGGHFLYVMNVFSAFLGREYC
jgi:hypothetical protein